MCVPTQRRETLIRAAALRLKVDEEINTPDADKEYWQNLDVHNQGFLARVK